MKVRQNLLLATNQIFPASQTFALQRSHAAVLAQQNQPAHIAQQAPTATQGIQKWFGRGGNARKGTEEDEDEEGIYKRDSYALDFDVKGTIEFKRI